MGWLPKISDSIESFGRVCRRCEKLALTESSFIARRKFDSFCRGYPKKSETSLVDLMVTRERQYRPHIEQLETRMTKLGKIDFKRVVYLDEPPLANATDKSLFIQDQSRLISKAQLGTVSGHRKANEVDRDKSHLISILLAYNGSLSVCPIIPLSEGIIWACT
jgi:hypothetical protein